MDYTDIIIAIIKVIISLLIIISFGGLLTWVERKQSALMQDRVGANRAYVTIPFSGKKITLWGLFHTIAEGVKMFTKEYFTPNTSDKILYNLAPFMAFIPVVIVFCVIPFGGPVKPGIFLDSWYLDWIPFLPDFFHHTFGEKEYPLVAANLNAGILFVFAISGLGIFGAILAGWSSNNKFSLLGSVRAAAQMISYEIPLGLSLMGIMLIIGSAEISKIVDYQNYLIGGYLPRWGIIVQPLGFIIFLVAAIAENKRIPFDLPECESELVAGYFTEYTGMKMGMFMFSEFMEIVVISGLAATIFFGSYHIPFLNDGGFVFPWGFSITLSHSTVVILRIISFFAKFIFLFWLQILIRWTLPRFRYDQLLSLGWKVLIPWSIFNLSITLLILYFID